MAAICAAPAVVLASHGLLDGKKATCYPAPPFTGVPRACARWAWAGACAVARPPFRSFYCIVILFVLLLEAYVAISLLLIGPLSFLLSFPAKLPERVDEKVVVDGNIITSQGPATAMPFALQVTKYAFYGCHASATRVRRGRSNREARMPCPDRAGAKPAAGWSVRRFRSRSA